LQRLELRTDQHMVRVSVFAGRMAFNELSEVVLDANSRMLICIRKGKKDGLKSTRSSNSPMAYRPYGAQLGCLFNTL
jgi:hypothetical protein